MGMLRFVMAEEKMVGLYEEEEDVSGCNQGAEDLCVMVMVSFLMQGRKLVKRIVFAWTKMEVERNSEAVCG